MNDLDNFSLTERAILQEYFRTGKIRSKEAFFILYNHGLLGNRPKIFKNLTAAMSSDWDGTFTIRVAIPGWKGMYEVKKEDLARSVELLCAQGVSEDKISFNQSMPDGELLLQGEIIDITDDESRGLKSGIHLTYTHVKKPMKEALKEKTLHAHGPDVIRLLRRFLNEKSQRELQDLVNSFPNHAIEFSTYGVEVGDKPGRNTVFWEVRMY